MLNGKFTLLSCPWFPIFIILLICPCVNWYWQARCKTISWNRWSKHIDGLAQDCSNSSTLAKKLLQYRSKPLIHHYNDVIMNTMASRITSLAIVYSSVYSATDQRIYQSSASLAFVRGIHRGPVNSPYKWPVTRKMSPFDDVIIVIIIMCACAPLYRDHG